MCLILFDLLFTFTEKSATQTPVTLRSSRLTAMEAFERRHKEKSALRERELLLKEKELEFQKQKLELEEEARRKRWEVEEAERRQKMEIEMEERKAFLELLKKHLNK